MLLRSSSTPVLGSLLSNFTDSGSNSFHSEASNALKHLPPTSVPQHHHKPSFNQTMSASLSSFSCSSSPISPSIVDIERKNKGFRRVQSDGNLEDLAYASFNSNEERLNYTDPPKRFSARQRCLTLETIPSFCISKHKGLRQEEEDEEWESDSEDMEERGELEEEKRAMEGKGDGFSVQNSGSGMILTKEMRVMEGLSRVSFADQKEVSGKEMYLSKGLGIDGCGYGIGGFRGSGGGGGGYNSTGSGGNDGDRHGVEEHYKKMLQENPGNPLFLRNYAQFLYQSKQDREGAEEYYSRAILADPKDGEVLSQYGKLVWELHHDQERASSYFERAVQASPEDSHVHAAYASFLWDTEEGEDGCDESQCLPSLVRQGAMATAGA